jgi:flavin reductase (DIM6/NTAB) family NADH-FMN oxidoreductase RutF
VTSGDELRTTMRRFPAGVAVLTLRLPFGVTIGSLVSVSLDPALVSVAIGLDSQAHELIKDEGGFAISLLSAEQEALAQHFARSVPPIALFEGVDIRDGARGPLLEGALGWLECEVRHAYPAGDHTLFVGEVERAELGGDGAGLVYRHGGYAPA